MHLVASRAGLTTLTRRPGTDLALVTGDGAFYLWTPPGESTADGVLALAAADGGVWRLLSGVVHSGEPSGTGNYVGQPWNRIVEGVLVTQHIWTGTAWAGIN